MEIKKIRKKGKLYQVEFDDERVFSWHENVIINHQLIRPKKVVNEKDLTVFEEENNYYLAIDKAIKYLSELRSKKQVKTYLNKYFDKMIVNRTIKYLEEKKLIEERHYCEAFLDYAYRNNRGYLWIKNALKDEEISINIIDEVLSSYTKEMQLEACSRAYLKQMNLYKKENFYGFNAKMRVFLINRGFNDEIITTTLEKHRNLLDNIIDDEKAFIKAFDRYFLKHSKSYQGRELETRMIRSLYPKGFSIEKIKNEIERREKNDS